MIYRLVSGDHRKWHKTTLPITKDSVVQNLLTIWLWAIQNHLSDFDKRGYQLIVCNGKFSKMLA